MNREIKFRGKDASGTWFFGDLHQWDNGEVYIGVHSNTWSDDGLNSQSYPTFNEVDPDTIGQFTGLHDKNGKEIYEGDIMRVPQTEFNAEIIGIVIYDGDGFAVRSRYDSWGNSLGWCVRERCPKERISEVIGNIHDNPELLKGGEK